MKNCIFHIPWKPDEKQNVAPDIRVIKISNAITNIGYNVEVIWGWGKERKQRIKKVKELIKTGQKFDFLYSESSTYPTMLTEPHHLPTYPLLDFSFFRFCKKHKIPIGLFYRDVYWNSKEVMRFNIFKQCYSIIFHVLDVLLYNKLLDKLFLPSVKMRKHIPFLRKSLPITTLFPGSELVDSVSKFNNKFLYVGSINPQLYDVSEMLNAFGETGVELYLCCRDSEWELFKEYYKNLLSPNISIIHITKEHIKEVYKKIAYTIIYLEPKVYREFAMPFKLFEYLSFEKPIITSKGTAVSEFVEKNKIGYHINYDSSSLKLFLNNLPSEAEYEKIVDNMIKIKKQNLWETRAKKIVDELPNFK
jgi:glycosyltransferase involved in cell wall biosynthesis